MVGQIIDHTRGSDDCGSTSQLIGTLHEVSLSVPYIGFMKMDIFPHYDLLLAVQLKVSFLELNLRTMLHSGKLLLSVKIVI